MSYSKLNPSKADPASLVMRMAVLRQDTANDGQRSIEAVIATENPVERFDQRSGEVIREVLLMSGLQMRTARNQLPIVDSHDRSTVRNILGSVRNIRVENDQLIGVPTFSGAGDGAEAYQKVREGHITDFSITATPLEITQVKRGQSYDTGREVIQGPAEIVTKWQPTDASLVATGADERSTVRDVLMRSYQDLKRKEIKRMSPETVKALVAKGMPSDLEDPDQIALWMLGQMSAMQMEDATETDSTDAAESTPITAADMTPITNDNQPKEASPMDETQIKKERQAALEADKIRRSEITALCTSHAIERSFADGLCDDFTVTVDIARAKVLNYILERTKIAEKEAPQGSVIRATGSEDDKFVAAARDGLIQRSIQSAGLRRPAFNGENRPAAGYEDFAKLGLFRTAERFLARANISTERMTAKDIAMVALNHQPTINRLRIQREAYHTTGSFANLMLDAANKTLLAGYDEAEYSWSIWARQAPSVADFKNINRIRFSEAPNLEMVPENHSYPEGQMSDSKESYKVEKFGSSFSVSWETVVNDDLDAISRIPAMQGNAARRTQNAKVYEVLTGNPLMSDGNNLFSTSHASGTNYVTSGAAPSVATLNAGFVAMMKQKGLNSSVTINVVPRFLIVPVALHATALQVVGSIADPLAGGASATGNSNTLNIYGPNGSRPLTVVSDPVLDASSAEFWYLAASPAQIDTVELTFLAGEETPVLENEWDYKTDNWVYKIRQTFAAKAIDWRGLYCNDGA